MLRQSFLLLLLFKFYFVYLEDSTNVGARKCISLIGVPQMCFPPFENYASFGKSIEATNTCGMDKRQKYCIGLSTAEMRSRCAYCDSYNPNERHYASFLTDQNPNNWWQSETLSDNHIIHYKESINLTLDLGTQFHVTFIHLQFKSPRPHAMIIHKKFDDSSPWEPWQYFSSNCHRYFGMPARKDEMFQSSDEVRCTEEFSSANNFYNGIVIFLSISGRPGSDNFFENKRLMKWATASQIRIELKKMFTFGDEIAEDELLLTHFYAIKSLQVAGRCWCNGHGNECRTSTGQGVQPKLYCVCHPSHQTTGQNCDKCENFYQDRPWKPANTTNANPCKKCECNGNADSCIFDEKLFIKSGNKSGGLCLNCRGNTKGPHCESCLNGYYLDTTNQNPNNIQCIPCNCDPVGSYNQNCDLKGQCVCKPGVEGGKCTRCKGDHYDFTNIGCQPCNCNPAGTNPKVQQKCNPITGICNCKDNVNGEKCNNCLGGFFSLTSGDPLGCQPCFCFFHTKNCKMATGFLIDQIESTFVKKTLDGWQYEIPGGKKYLPMLDFELKYPAITWFKARDPWKENYFLLAPKKFLGNRRLSYNLELELHLSFIVLPGFKSFSSSRLITMTTDIQLVSGMGSVGVPFDAENSPPEADGKIHKYRYRINEISGDWRDKMDHFHFISILSNLTAIKIRLTNSDGYVKLHKAVLNMAVSANDTTSKPAKLLPVATTVEHCKCPPQYIGLSCETCASGYHRDSSNSHSTPFVKCIPCSCNNQTDTCEIKTGKCHCQFNTVGHNCQTCKVGYYGDPTSKVRNICKKCGCPGGGACEIVKMIGGDKIVCTDCPDNLGGYRCNRCRDNYFGNPLLNIPCKPCNCHGNIDYFNSCNHLTGKCTNCLFNSFGDNCETCLPGYYLLPSELAPNRCKPCRCNSKGSQNLECDIKTSSCLCKSLVMGKLCDTCQHGYFNLTGNSKSKACQPCNCFPVGSKNVTCHPGTGQCQCKTGITEIKCNRCKFGFFNLTDQGCQPCNCDKIGSITRQCDEVTGKCKCKQNIIGEKCDKCKENFFNITANCVPCSACYGVLQNDINIIRSKLNNLEANQLKQSFNNSKNIWNTPKMKELIKKYNKDLTKLVNSILSNIDKYKNIDKDVKNIQNNLRKIVDTISKKMAEKHLNLTISEIKNIENEIKQLFNNVDKNIEKLETFVRSKSISNANMTDIAKQAQEYYKNMTNQQQNYLNDINEAEKLINTTLPSLVEYVASFHTFINKTLSINSKSIETVNERVAKSTEENIKRAEELNSNLSNLLNEFNQFEKELAVMVTNTNKLKNSEAKLNTNELNKSIKKIQSEIESMNNQYNQIEELIKTDKLADVNIVELNKMLKLINETETKINDGINKARENLKKLENFEEVVNITKTEAINYLKKLPELKKEYEILNNDIVNLENKTLSIITSIQDLVNDSSINQILNQNLIEKLKKLLNNTSSLDEIANTTLVFARYVNVTYFNAQNQQNNILLDIGKMADEINQIKKIEQFQNGTNEEVQNKINELVKFIENFNSNSSKQIQIDPLTDKLEKFITQEYNELKNQSNLMSRDWSLLDAEKDIIDKEIDQLKLIDSMMLGTKECYKTGVGSEGVP